jgi:hypothetical protein
MTRSHSSPEEDSRARTEFRSVFSRPLKWPPRSAELLVGREAARISHRPDPVVTLAVPGIEGDSSRSLAAGRRDTREGNREHLPPNR